jgi:hypothetical protein
MEIGKIYRLRHRGKDWLEATAENAGYLWIWEGERDGTALAGYVCRSLATGETECFYPMELEAADD